MDQSKVKTLRNKVFIAIYKSYTSNGLMEFSSAKTEGKAASSSAHAFHLFPSILSHHLRLSLSITLLFRSHFCWLLSGSVFFFFSRCSKLEGGLGFSALSESSVSDDTASFQAGLSQEE